MVSPWTITEALIELLPERPTLLIISIPMIATKGIILSREWSTDQYPLPAAHTISFRLMLPTPQELHPLRH